MLDDSHAGKDGKGVWLWTIASGLILFVMEFILFAALVPTDWARQVSSRELASLVATVGPDTADAILARAAGWFDTLVHPHRPARGQLPGADSRSRCRWGGAREARGQSLLALARRALVGRVVVARPGVPAACGAAVVVAAARHPGRCRLGGWVDAATYPAVLVRLCESADASFGVAGGSVGGPRGATAASWRRFRCRRWACRWSARPLRCCLGLALANTQKRL